MNVMDSVDINKLELLHVCQSNLQIDMLQEFITVIICQSYICFYDNFLLRTFFSVFLCTIRYHTDQS